MVQRCKRELRDALLVSLSDIAPCSLASILLKTTDDWKTPHAATDPVIAPQETRSWSVGRSVTIGEYSTNLHLDASHRDPSHRDPFRHVRALLHGSVRVRAGGRRP